MTLETSLQPTISSRTALQALVSAQGNLELAAELLGTKPEFLVAALVLDENNYDTLQKYLRALGLLRVFSSLDNLSTSLQQELAEGNLKGKDVAKAFTDTANLLNQLTDTHTTTSNINVFETVMRTLPPHVQTALKVLAKPEPNTNTNDSTAHAAHAA